MAGEVVEDTDSPEEDDPLVKLTALGVLALGLLALFLGFEWFWVVFVVGYAAVLPMVGVLSRHYGPLLPTGRVEQNPRGRDRRSSGDDREDALETLKERYARGEIDEAEFEARLERLVENESVADVQARVERSRERHTGRGDAERETEDRDLEFETDY
jgi:uncharacterized membrane protein